LALETNLKKISDKEAILSVLSEIKEFGLEAHLWKLVGDEIYLAGVTLEAIRKSTNDICLVPVKGQEDVVANIVGNNIFLDIQIPNSSIFFRCKLKSVKSPHRYYVIFPEFFALPERRKGVRIKFIEESKVRVSFNKANNAIKTINQKFIKNCYDIGVGGFSFLISRAELKYFNTNDVIPEVEINLDQEKIKLSSKVKVVREIEPDEYNGLSYKVWRVSCAYVKIEGSTHKKIENFIIKKIKNEINDINIGE
jgi:hypothetical protein